MPDSAPDPDGERMRRWASGDRSAFEEIVRAWQTPVGRFLVRLTGAADAAADLTQEVFLRVYLGGGRYTHGGSFKTWLYQIALNLARDHVRRLARKPTLPLADAHDPPGDAGEACDMREQAEVVAAAVAGLPGRLREVVVLRHYEDLNFEAMSRLLGVPATTLKSRFAVAMKKLEQVLVPKLGEVNMPDDFPELRKLLDTVPPPDPEPVDLARLYCAALDRQTRVARRWKRAAVGVAAMAASVLAFALLPKLELRANGHEFAVRWGTPPEVEVQPDPRIQLLLDEQARQLAAIRVTSARHTDLQDLLLTLAADVSQRDRDQQQKMLALAKRLREFETLTAKQFQETEKTNTALYHAVFNTKPKGVNP